MQTVALFFKASASRYLCISLSFAKEFLFVRLLDMLFGFAPSLTSLAAFSKVSLFTLSNLKKPLSSTSAVYKHEALSCCIGRLKLSKKSKTTKDVLMLSGFTIFTVQKFVFVL